MIVCPIKELGRYAAIIPGLAEGLEVLNGLTDYSDRVIPMSGGNRVLVQQGMTKLPQGKLSEAHRQYLDVQCILEGCDTVGWAPVDKLTEVEPFNTEKDIGWYDGPVDFVNVRAGHCYVVFPEDAHMPNTSLETPCKFTKVVLKLKL